MRILHSYRWRRRLIIWTLLVGIAAPLIYLGVHYSTPGESTEATGPAVPNEFYEQPKNAPFTAAKQHKVSRALARFMSTAVARKHVAESWPVTGPSLREGFTRKQWSTGAIPVEPYPVAKKGLGHWDVVQYSYRNAVGLEVLLWPRAGSGQAPLSADVDVIKDRHGRWRIDYFMPKKYHGAPSLAAPAKPKAKVKRKVRQHHAERKHRATQRRVAAPAMNEPPRQSRLWWALPIGLLALIVLVPLTVGVFVWIRNRRAQADYARWRR